jgi:hypothetical protein
LLAQVQLAKKGLLVNCHLEVEQIQILFREPYIKMGDDDNENDKDENDDNDTLQSILHRTGAALLNIGMY